MTVFFRILVLAVCLSCFAAEAQTPEAQPAKTGSPSYSSQENASFDHNKTRYPLTGKHKTLKCEDCHQSAQYGDKSPAECLSCHAKNEKHSGRFSRNCGDCHTGKTWKEINFDHSKTAFPLMDAHATLACFSCHRDGPFRVRSACASCHLKDDSHKGDQGAACGNCHNQKSWKDTQFDHDGKTDYPLIGKHKAVPCASCHKDNQYRNQVPSACASCHQKQDTHKGALGQTCETCHTETGWKNSLFDHAKQTGTPLIGQHQTAPCAGCHRGGKYQTQTPDLCVYCHAQDDGHKKMFGALCGNCHTPTGWKDITFKHQIQKFPLKEKHQQVKCQACHQGRLYTVRPPSDCYSCHRKKDKHKGQLGRQCEKCHGEQGWGDTVLD